ncbi:MAG: NAD(P)/FAD-dependent oxidoreductase [Chitinophagaceae bacterium]
MKETVLDVIVIGAGFAGLSASYHLKKYGLSHLVFERGKIGESWRSQRWDAFRLNSTNRLNVLPGMICDEENAELFPAATAFVSSMEQYVSACELPVQENSKVISIEKKGEFFDVAVLSNNVTNSYYCKQVIIASGASNEIKIPSFSKNLSPEIKQLHTSEYRNAGELPAGAVLVAGSAQSGVQIAADLLAAGRKVWLSTSKVARIPRWYRGKDIFYWLIDTKVYDTRAEEVSDPTILESRNPQISGTGTGKDTVSLQQLAKKGAIILGKMDNADQQNIFFQTNAAMHVKFADIYSQKIKKMIDDFIFKNGLTAPVPHYDEADRPDTEAACASAITSLNLRKDNISSIIWTTGFNSDLSYIKLPVFNDKGKLVHHDGIAAVPGLYFIGYPWQRSHKSTILFGILEDAAFVTDKVYNDSKKILHQPQL